MALRRGFLQSCPLTLGGAAAETGKLAGRIQKLSAHSWEREPWVGSRAQVAGQDAGLPYSSFLHIHFHLTQPSEMFVFIGLGEEPM